LLDKIKLKVLIKISHSNLIAMPWYYRKSINFRFGKMNFSKSGISYSFGVKGARINTGPRGTFVSLGQNGVYYRKKISREDPNSSN
jgi:hypothetical protein